MTRSATDYNNDIMSTQQETTQNPRSTAREDYPLLPKSPPEKVSTRNLRRSSIIDHFVFLDPPTEQEAIRRHDALLLQPGIGPAAFLLRDAVMGDNVENPAEGAYVPYFSDSTTTNTRINRLSIVCRRLCSHRTLLSIFYGACWGIASLSFIEPPPWCERQALASNKTCVDLLSTRGPSITDSSDNVEYYPNTHSSVILSLRQATLLQAVLITYILVFQMLRIGRDGCSWSRYLRTGPARWNRIMQCLATVILVADCLVPNQDYYWMSFHTLAPYARLSLLISLNTANVQRDLWSLIHMLPRVVPVLILLLFIVLFYAWFGTVSFVGTRQGQEHFPNLVDACVSFTMCYKIYLVCIHIL